MLLCALVFALGGLPLLAIRLGKVPLPPITLPAPAGGPPGHAVLAVVGAAVLATAGGLAGRLLVAVGCGVLLLRSRLFVAVRHRVPAVAAGLAGYALLGAVLADRSGPAGRLALALGGLALALVAVAAGTTYARRPVSPYLGRLADLTDTALVVAVVPVACAVLDLYDRARGLLG
ncbi:hypothetical protein B0E53_07031 [Micromonospora sp. MH33]|nr:hypothetical protein B0E53_07031 [Micromonospora sp. MH33]